MLDTTVDDGSPRPDRIRTRSDFTREFTALREHADLTVRQIAAKVGRRSAHSTIGDWFAGRGLPSTSSVDLFRQVLGVCGVHDPDTVAQWLDAWRRVRRVPGPRPGGPEPYRGLASYQPEDAEWFFGRRALTAQLVARLGALRERGGGLLLVVGASGSGKSSLLRAGLLPALAAGGWPGSASWPVWLLTPGPRPLDELAAVQTGGTTPPGDAPPVVVVDQFEEVFTVCADEAERSRFIVELAALADGPNGALVVLGLRADFYAHALRHPPLLAAVQDGQFTVGPMNEAELRAAIVEPALRAHVEVEDELVELLVREVAPRAGDPDGHDAGTLPLLSHALYATWNHDRRRLTCASYRDIGGLDGAVAASASQAYDELDDHHRALARRLFLNLVHVSTDTADTRRRVMTADLLVAPDDDAAGMREILDRFIAQRLIIAGVDSVQISHEALLTAWPRLRSWLDTDRASLVVGRQLAVAAATWRDEGRDPTALYGGTRLAAAHEWIADHPRETPPAVQEFIAASARHARRRSRRLYRLVAALAALALATCVLAGYAFQQRASANAQRRAAVDQRNQAISRLVAGRADRLRDQDVSLSMQLSLAAYRIAPTLEARSSLLDAYVTPGATRLRGFTTVVQSVAYRPDRKLLAAGGLDDDVRLWDTSDPSRPPVPLEPPLRGPTQGVFAVAFSPDGHVLAAAGADARVHLWNVADPRHPYPLGAPLTGPESTVYAVAFAPDGRTLAAGGADHRIRLWDVTRPESPRLRTTLTGPGDAVQAVAFNPAGTVLAAGSADATVRLWDTRDPDAPAPLGVPLTGHALKVFTVAFSPDGHTLASGSADRTVRLWNVAEPARPVLARVLTGPTSWVNAVAFSPDGGTVAAGTSDRQAVVWDTATGRTMATLPHPEPVTSISFGADGDTLATASTDAIVRVWTLPGPVAVGPGDSVFNLAFRADGRMLAVASSDQTVRLYDVTDARRPVPVGGPITSPPGRSPFAGTVAYRPDGRMLAIGTRAGPVQLWDITDVHRPALVGSPLTGLTALVETVAFSPDGNILAAGGDDSRVQLWDVSDSRHPRPLATITGIEGLVFCVTFGPDGRWLAEASSDGTARLWDVTDPSRPSPRGQPLTGFHGYAYGAAFSPDGRTLAVSSADKTIRRWNLAGRGDPVPFGTALAGPTSYVYWIAYSPDGRTLAAADTDGTVWLWDTADPAHPAAVATLTRPTDAVYTLAFSPDGRFVAAAGADRTVRLWDTDPARVGAWICATAGAPISRTEWEQYVPGAPYDPPC